MHGVVTIQIGEEEAGGLLVEYRGSCFYQYAHPASLNINDVHSGLTTAYNEGEVFFIKLREEVVSILVNVFGVWIIDSFGHFPVVYKENMFLTTIKHHFLWCIFKESLYSLNFEVN